MAKKEITPESVWNEYETACNFKAGLNLYDNVRANENFYIGKQWEGVQSNGLPTPVFNFIKRIILYVVASTATDNLKMAASPLSSSGMAALGDLERLTDVVNAQFEALFEQNKLRAAIRLSAFLTPSAIWCDTKNVLGLSLITSFCRLLSAKMSIASSRVTAGPPISAIPPRSESARGCSRPGGLAPVPPQFAVSPPQNIRGLILCQ